MDVSRDRRAEVIDEHAAIFILQGALDRLASAIVRQLTMGSSAALAGASCSARRAVG